MGIEQMCIDQSDANQTAVDQIYDKKCDQELQEKIRIMMKKIC